MKGVTLSLYLWWSNAFHYYQYRSGSTIELYTGHIKMNEYKYTFKYTFEYTFKYTFKYTFG